MGGKVSSLKYYQIIQVIDLASKKDPNKFLHIIKFDNGKEKVIKLNSKEERMFQVRYKYTKMFKDISKIKYSKITNIIKENIDESKYNLLNKYVLDEENMYVYKLKLILDDDTIQIINVNKIQYDLFCKIYYDINKTKV
jgi:hypothetical protein